MVACCPVPKAWLAGMVRVDIETPGLDRLEILLAGDEPVGVGKLFFHEFGRPACKQVRQRFPVGFRGLVRKPGFELPVVGPVFGDLAAAQDDFRIPVERILMRHERAFDDFARSEGGQFPAHGVSVPASMAWASLSSRFSKRFRAVAA